MYPEVSITCFRENPQEKNFLPQKLKKQEENPTQI